MKPDRLRGERCSRSATGLAPWWAGSGVTLVTAPEELERAAVELGGYTDYVILRISEQQHGANGNRAQSLRQIIEHQGYIARPPTPGEREALETGIDAMGIPRSGQPTRR